MSSAQERPEERKRDRLPLPIKKEKGEKKRKRKGRTELVSHVKRNKWKKVKGEPATGTKVAMKLQLLQITFPTQDAIWN